MKTELTKKTYITFIKEQKRIQKEAKSYDLSYSDKIFIRHWNLAYKLIKSNDFQSLLKAENSEKTKKQVHISIIKEICQKYELLIDSSKLLSFYEEHYREEVYKFSNINLEALSYSEKYILSKNRFNKDQ